MATPTVTSAAFRKLNYALGETIFLDIVYADTDRKVLTASIKITDPEGNVSSTATAVCTIDQGTVEVTSNLGKVWTLVSDTGTNATYSTVA
jgi:hypothetical protein